MAVKGNLPPDSPSMSASLTRDESKTETVSAKPHRMKHTDDDKVKRKKNDKLQDASKIFKGLQALYS